MLSSSPIADAESDDPETTRKGSCQWSTGLLDGAADTFKDPLDTNTRSRSPIQGSWAYENLAHHFSGPEGPSSPHVQVVKRNFSAPAVGAPAKFAEHVGFDRYANHDGVKSDQYLRDSNSGYHQGFLPATRDVSQGNELRGTAKIGADPAQGRLEETGERRQKIPRRFRSISILNTNADQHRGMPLSSPAGTRSPGPASITSARPGPENNGKAYCLTHGPVQSSERPPRAQTFHYDEQSYGPKSEPASRFFFCAHPWCTQSDPVALCQETYAHAFGSLMGLMQHISEYHPAYSRGGPGEFLCAFPHPGGQQAQLASFASLRELLNHLTESTTHEQGEVGPLFSWGYISTLWYDRPLHSYAGDYQIYVAAFPSMGHMVSGHANQYARMAYGTTKYRVVDKKQRLQVHGSQFPPPPPHATPPPTMPFSALTEEVYLRHPPPPPALQRSSSARSLRSSPQPSHQVLSRPYVNALPGTQTRPPFGYPLSGGIPRPASQNYNQAMLTNASIYLPTTSSASLGPSKARSSRPKVLYQADARLPNHASSASLGQKRGSRSSLRSEVKAKGHHQTKAPSRL